MGREGTGTFALSRSPVPASTPKSSGPARSHGLPFLPQPRQPRLPLQTVFFLGESYYYIFFFGHVESGMDESCRDNLLRAGGRAPNPKPPVLLPCLLPARLPEGRPGRGCEGPGRPKPRPGASRSPFSPVPRRGFSPGLEIIRNNNRANNAETNPINSRRLFSFVCYRSRGNTG